jgi:hypothetical protein
MHALDNPHTCRHKMHMHMRTQGIKERIIYDVSIANEKMSQDLQQLKQYVLDLRREARACGCELNSSRVLTLFPELHTLINDTSSSSTKQANSIGSGSKQANSSGSQEGSPGVAGGSAQAAKEGDAVANTAAQQQA